MHDVFKSKTMVVQQKLAKRRERLTSRIELVEDPNSTEPEVTPTLHLYIALHLTLMIGYAKAGAAPLEGAPTTPETKESDSTDYVVCPLDVLLAYHYRLVDCARRLPYPKALAWVQSKDEADREEWIERIRRSSLPLGKVVKQVTEARAAMWEIPDVPKEPAADPRGAKRPRAEPVAERLPRAEQKKVAFKPNQVLTTDTMRDGVKICRDWNNGGRSEPCPHSFRHVCNALVKNRACGMRNHRSIKCRSARAA